MARNQDALTAITIAEDVAHDQTFQEPDRFPKVGLSKVNSWSVSIGLPESMVLVGASLPSAVSCRIGACSSIQRGIVGQVIKQPAVAHHKSRR